MIIQTILAFIGATTLLALLPGPDNLFVLTESLSNGFKSGLAIVMGLCLGVLVHILGVISGFSLFVINNPNAFDAMKYFGILYLLYLVYGTWTDLKANTSLSAEAHRPMNLIKGIRTGFFMNVLNPKVALFFIAFLPQFIDVQSELYISSQMLLLGGIFIVITFVVFGGIAFLAGRLQTIVKNPRFWAIANKLKIIVLLVMVVFLLRMN